MSKPLAAAAASSSFPRSELEEMVERWIAANHEAERRGDWTALADFYTPDAVYEWNMGPHQEFVASGRQEIGQVALGYHMKGFEDWKYPYREVFIDEKRGTVIVFWDQVAPCQRRDGTPYQVDGVGGSRFDYAGEFQWRYQRDFFDLGNTKALLFELAGAGQLDPAIRAKIHEQARGVLLPGTHRIRPEPSLCSKLQNFLAMLRIVVFG